MAELKSPYMIARETLNASYAICSKSDSSILGHIRWYGACRQYCFFPAYETLYNNGCLRSITDFLEQLNKEQKEK
jgi:hypothetical protein